MELSNELVLEEYLKAFSVEETSKEYFLKEPPEEFLLQKSRKDFSWNNIRNFSLGGTTGTARISQPV